LDLDRGFLKTIGGKCKHPWLGQVRGRSNVWALENILPGGKGEKQNFPRGNFQNAGFPGPEETWNTKKGKARGYLRPSRGKTTRGKGKIFQTPIVWVSHEKKPRFSGPLALGFLWEFPYCSGKFKGTIYLEA